jgi:hypothetical protein
MNLKEIVREVVKRNEEAQYGIEWRARANILINISFNKKHDFLAQLSDYQLLNEDCCCMKIDRPNKAKYNFRNRNIKIKLTIY